MKLIIKTLLVTFSLATFVSCTVDDSLEELTQNTPEQFELKLSNFEIEAEESKNNKNSDTSDLGLTDPKNPKKD